MPTFYIRCICIYVYVCVDVHVDVDVDVSLRIAHTFPHACMHTHCNKPNTILFAESPHALRKPPPKKKTIKKNYKSAATALPFLLAHAHCNFTRQKHAKKTHAKKKIAPAPLPLGAFHRHVLRRRAPSYARPPNPAATSVN